MTINPAQCRAARGLLDWTQSDLCRMAKVSPKTIRDFERGTSTPYERTLRDIVAAFERFGVEFINHDAPGVRLREGAPLTNGEHTAPAPTSPGPRKRKGAPENLEAPV